MLRISFMQHWFGYSDPAMEDELLAQVVALCLRGSAYVPSRSVLFVSYRPALKRAESDTALLYLKKETGSCIWPFTTG